jgi:endo-alpha-1,4-polygalactosaminidase (GH114 family)
LLSINGYEKFSNLGWTIFEHIPQAAHTLRQDFFKMPSAVTPETLDRNGEQLKERLQASSAEETVLWKQHLPRTADNMVESYDRNFVSVSASQ